MRLKVYYLSSFAFLKIIVYYAFYNSHVFCRLLYFLYSFIFACSVSNSGLGATPMNGIGISSTAGSAPTAMYRPNFSQAFQRAGPYPLFPGQTPFGATGGLLTNG